MFVKENPHRKKNKKQNKTEDLNLSVFNVITGINELKILIKHTSCTCKFKFDGRKCNCNQKWNKHKCWCECKIQKNKIMFGKKIIFGIFLHTLMKMVNIYQ